MTYKLGGEGLRSLDNLRSRRSSGLRERLRRLDGGVLDLERDVDLVSDLERLRLGERGDGDLDLDRVLFPWQTMNIENVYKILSAVLFFFLTQGLSKEIWFV